jgi:D-alanyl-D-alanine carboxypeptidase (penicillin-binding protein 5/6)
MSYALRFPRLKEIIGTRVAELSTENGDSIFLRNTNRLLWSEDELVGGKTGFTRKARHCFVCASERGNSTVVVAVLGSPSRENLWKESESLLARGFEVIGNKENPVVYVTNLNYDSDGVKKASYKKSSKAHGRKKMIARKASKEKKMIAKKALKNKKTKMLANKKNKGKKFAKSKRKKPNYSMAERGEDRNKG